MVMRSLQFCSPGNTTTFNYEPRYLVGATTEECLFYNIEDLKVEAFGGRSLKVGVLLYEESRVWGLLVLKIFDDSTGQLKS